MLFLDDDTLPAGWTYGNGTFTLEDVYSQVATSRMGPDERASFMDGKRQELSEFFGNDVWEFHEPTGNEDPDRILKAKWVLKWTKWPDGTPRAKARLVLQGFNDPDALQGKVETSSPAVSRIGRNLCMQMAATKKWKLWKADVPCPWNLSGRWEMTPNTHITLRHWSFLQVAASRIRRTCVDTTSTPARGAPTPRSKNSRSKTRGT